MVKSLRKNRRGNILTENVIFIILNLVFLSILLLFVASKTGSAAVLEEKYAKQITLAVDSAEPVMEIHLNMEDAIEMARKGDRDLSKIISIQDNVVHVQLREEGGYSYSFFNDVDVTSSLKDNNKEYVFLITQNE